MHSESEESMSGNKKLEEQPEESLLSSLVDKMYRKQMTFHCRSGKMRQLARSVAKRR